MRRANLFLALIILSAVPAAVHADPTGTVDPRATADRKVGATSPKGDVVINDAWYTMQAGSTPFGYYHEVIEQRGDRYSYRYALKKFVNNSIYEENIGALSELDLTPVAFNLNKTGRGATETTNATYSANKFGGVIAIQVSGARLASFKRACSRETILDVFFPIYLKNHWDKVRPGAKGWLKTFAEDPESSDFRARTINYVVRGRDSEKDCTSLHVEMDSMKWEWCMTPEGVLVELKTGNYVVKMVKSESEAEAFVAGVFPKKKKGE